MKALLLAALAALVLAGCSSPSKDPVTPPMVDGAYQVKMTSGNTFDPATAKVPVGAKVTWMNTGGVHDVQADDGSFSSGTAGGVQKGGAFSHTFDKAGTYTYHCLVHESVGMKGTLTVA